MSTVQDPTKPPKVERDPFDAAAGGDFFFTDATRSQQLNMLVHLVQHSELLLLVSGVQGIGKSSLRKQFLGLAEDAWRLCVIEGHRGLGSVQLLEHICRSFQAETVPGDCLATLDALRARLVSFKLNLVTPILLVDDAHELPDEALQLVLQLADLADAGDKLLRIMLFSEPLTDDILSPPTITALRARATHTLEIPPLSEAEMRHYLAARLQAAGSSYAPNAGQLKRIYRTSRGIPAQINRAAHDLLLGTSAATNPLETRDAGRAEKPQHRVMTILALVGGAVLLAGLIMSLPFGPASTSHEQRPDEGRRAEQESIVLAPPAKLPNLSVAAPAQRLPIEPVPYRPSVDETAAAAQREEADAAAYPGVDAVRPSLAVEPATQEVATAPPVSVQHPSSDAGMSPAATAPIPAEPRPAAAALQTPVADVPDARAETDTGPAGTGQADREAPTAHDKSPLSVVASQEPAVASHRDTKEAMRSGTESATGEENPTDYRAWLTAQDPTHWTLQIMGASNRAPLEHVLQTHGLRNQVYIVPTSRNTENWFVAVLGSYSRVEEARATITSLPDEVQAQQPWPRRIGSLAAAVKATASSESAGSRAARPGSDGPDALPGWGIRREDWLLAQNPTHYTIVLLGTRQEEALLEYVKTQKLSGKAAYFRTRYREGPWYVLLHGIYPNKEAASEAITRLPEGLGNAPWVRSLAGVHDEIGKLASPSATR